MHISQPLFPTLKIIPLRECVCRLYQTRHSGCNFGGEIALFTGQVKTTACF